VVDKRARHLLVTCSLLALLVSFLSLAMRAVSKPYLGLLAEGDEYALRAERSSAVAAYREAARLWPGDPVPYLRLAQVYVDWGRAEEAMDALSTAEELGAREANGVGLERLWVAAAIARGDWPAVEEHAQRLLDLLPGAADARHALAQAYVEMLEWDAAQAEYEALLQADATDSLAHERLGTLLVGGDPVAIQHLIAAQTDLAGQVMDVLGQSVAASDPAYASALVGRVLFEAGEWALAARHLRRALSFSPDYADAHAYLGYALSQLDRSGEAGSHLRQAVELAPDSVVAHTFLGLYYEQQGDFSAARAAYETAYDLDRDNPATCVEIGQTWAAEGRYVAAEIWFLEAVTLQADDPALWEILARFYLDHNISAGGKGLEAAEVLTELSPADARARDLLGWAALQLGDYAVAEENLLMAVSLDPWLASAHYHLGLLREAQGDPERAQEAFVRALDLDTNGELIPLVERAMGEKP
jgi:tetratricopeptide (TPR) repeat protein